MRKPSSSRSYKTVRRAEDSGPRRCRIPITAPFDIGLCIRARRYQLKLGQADLATQVGLGRQWIMACESGKGGVELALVIRTLTVLGLELSVLDGDAPAWTAPLTGAAGTAARPYAKARGWRNAATLPKG